MTNIKFIRHAESTYNAKQEFVKDPPLSSLGKKQAAKIFGHYDVIIISNLKRSLQTLNYSNITYDIIVTDEDCREIRNGAICDYLENEKIINESQSNINKRIIRFTQTVNKLITKGVEDILIISHGAFIVEFLQLKKELDNCEIINATNKFLL